MAIYLMIIAFGGIFVLFLNILSYIQVSKQSKKLFDQIKLTSVEEAMKVLRNEKKIGKMVGLITASFMLVYVPLVLLMLVPKVGYEKPMLGVISFSCAYLLVVIDPIVYIYSSEKYRDAIRMILSPSCSRISEPRFFEK